MVVMPLPDFFHKIAKTLDDWKIILVFYFSREHF